MSGKPISRLATCILHVRNLIWKINAVNVNKVIFIIKIDVEM